MTFPRILRRLGVLAGLLPGISAAQSEPEKVYVPKGGSEVRVVTLVNFGPGAQDFIVTAAQDANPGWTIGFGAFPGPPFANITAEVFGPGYQTGLIEELFGRQFAVLFETDGADFGDTKSLTTTAYNVGNLVIPYIQVEFEAEVMSGDLVLRDFQEVVTVPPNGPPPPPSKLGDDVHTPYSPPTTINAATATTAARYRVDIENEGDTVQSFVLTVQEQGSSDWAPKYLIGDLDVTEGLRAGGVLFPDMNPGETRSVSVEILPGPGITTEGDQFAAAFILNHPDEGDVMDAVVAAGEYFAGGLEAVLEAKPGATTDDFNLELTITNTSAQPATSIVPLIDLGTEGELDFDYTGPATPASVATLAPGASALFTRPITVDGEGEVTVSAGARGILQNASGQIRPGLSNVAEAEVSALPILEIVTDPDRVFKKDEVFVAKVIVRHRGEGSKTYEFPSALIAEDPPPAEDPMARLMIREFETPEPFVLSEGDSMREFPVTVLAENRGGTKLVSSIEVTDGEGAMSTENAERAVIVSPFEITTTVTPEELRLNQTPLEKLGPRATALNQERLAMEQPVLRNLFEIEMTVKNASSSEVANVNIPGILDILSFISSKEEESLGVPLTPLFLYPPGAARIDLQDNSETPEIDDVTLAAGESAVFAWVLEAYDGNTDPESDDSLKMEFEAVVLGSIDGRNVQDRGSAEFRIVDKPLVKWGIRPKDGRTAYLSGQIARVDGFLENISGENGNDPKDLLVMMYPLQEGNLGGGFPKKAELPNDAFPKYYEIFELPGEGETRIDIDSFFVSFPALTPTEGTVRYGIRVWILEDDDTLTSADDQAVIDDDWSDEFEVTFQASPRLISAAEQRRKECIALGIWPIVCGFEEGLFDFSQGIYGLGTFMLSAVETNAKLYNGLIAYEMLAMKSLFDAARGEPDAFDELFRDSYDKYVQLVELGVMAGEAGSKVPMVFDAFVQQSGDAMVSFFDAAFEGDMEEVQFQIGHFLGANPDLLLEPLAVGMTYARLARSARVAEAGAINDVIAAQRLADQARQQQGVSQRLAAAKADPSVTDLSSALLPGDKLSRRTLLDVFGVDEYQLKRLQEIARNNGVMISFRSRSRFARSLLDNNLAWPKPQALKFKSVNRIDIDYLGYREGTDAILEIVEPPVELLGKTGKDLENALDGYMEGMKSNFPELAQNDVLFGEVRNRLKTRTKEWDDYAPALELNGSGESVVSIPSNFEANLQFGTKKERDLIPDIAPEQVRFVKTTADGGVIDPATGATRKKWTLEMSEGVEVRGSASDIRYDPNVNYDFKPVTGDLDVMAITEPNGGMILDADRRLKVYKQLAEAVQMQHGESFTFFIDSARTKFLDKNTFGLPGAEALCTISPFGDQTPTAAFFVKSLSIIEGLNQKFLPVREAIKKADKLKLTDGKFVLEKGKTIVTRRPDVTGEYIVMAGAEINSLIDLQFVSRFRPQILQETIDFYKRIQPFFIPVYIAKWIGIADDSENFARPNPASNLLSPRGPRPIGVMDPPLLQLARNPATGGTEPMVWEEGSGWRFITDAEAVDLGAPGILDMLPMSYLTGPVERNSTTLPIASMAELGASGDFFEVGDRILIAPGSKLEEFGTLQSVDPFVLAMGTIYAHEAGTLVATLGEDDTDRDGDTLTGAEEIALGTNPDLFDTDYDGISDGAEVLQGSDPLTCDCLAFSEFSVDGREVALSWDSSLGYRYQLQGSTTLLPGSWTVLRTITGDGGAVILDLAEPFPDSDRGFFRLEVDGVDDGDLDGLTSRDELGLGTDPAKADTDGDGILDGDEEKIGTDPLDPDSRLAIYTSELLDSLGLYTVRFSSSAGVTYRVESSTSLSPGSWREEAVVTAISSVTVVEVPADLENEAARFYRVRALVP